MVQLRVAIAILPSQYSLAVSKAVLSYSMSENVEVDIGYYQNIDLLKKNYANTDALFVNYEFLEANKESLGDLFKCNVECYPVIIGSSEGEICNYLSIRPSAYTNERNIKNISAICSDITSKICSSGNVIQLATKQGIYAISVASILYCTSYQKYVSIITDTGKEFRKISKLDDYAGSLPPYMIRIHQSYLVNSKHIKTLDKSSWVVILDSEEQLPVSKAYRGFVSEYLQKCPLDG